MSEALEVIAVNVYVRNPTLALALWRLRHYGADLIGISEGYRIRAGGLRYRRFGRRTPRDARDVPILLRRALDVGSGMSVRMSPDLGTRVAPERWATRRRFHKGGAVVSAINTHLNAAIQDPRTGAGRPDTPGGRAAAEHAAQIVALADVERATGCRPVVTADGNYAVPRGDVRTLDDAWKGSLPGALHAAGYRVELDGVDVIAWHPRDFEMIARDTVPVPGSDHGAAPRVRLRIR